jgi:NADPH-dependent glutamate synthase beta subunit-like oxidoreductase
MATDERTSNILHTNVGIIGAEPAGLMAAPIWASECALRMSS